MSAIQFFCFRRPRPIAFRELRVNEQIRIPSLRLFDDTTGEQLGIVPLEQARRLAVERELDLVEVAPMAQPPVCRLMDYGRYKFEALKREKESRREHNIIRVKEMKLRPKISENDFQTKYGYVRHFLAEGDKVKLTIMFRGREMVHQEYGRRLLDRLAAELKDVAIIERMPLVEGRNMIMIMSPLAKKATREGDPTARRREDEFASTNGSEFGAEGSPTVAAVAPAAGNANGNSSTVAGIAPQAPAIPAPAEASAPQPAAPPQPEAATPTPTPTPAPTATPAVARAPRAPRARSTNTGTGPSAGAST